MTSAYVLILAILVLGGLIAALGDRIGSKVGKARLTLFNLRPKQTAILITIGTGILISSSTLLILFTLSESLRQGVFELDEILKKRREITKQLESVELEKNIIETEKERMENELDFNKELLAKTQKQIKLIERKSNALTTEVEKIIDEKNKLLEEKKQIEQQTKILEESIQEKDQELNDKDQELNSKEKQIIQQEEILQQQENSLAQLKSRQARLESDIKSRDQQIAQLDQRISESNQILKNKENELISLEKQLEFFRKEAETLEQYYQTYQDLRERPITIVKGQILTVTLVQTEAKTNIVELIDGILSEANRGVMVILGYGNQSVPQRFIQISKGQVEQIKQSLSTPGQYLVRIVSAGNYVQGEEQIRIFADVTPNKKIYEANQTIASINLEDGDLKSNELQEKLDFLISVSQFRARREGILGRIFIGDGKITSLVNFIQKLQLSNESIDEVRAVVASESYTSGPLQINLVVLVNGKEVLRL
jgi:uncharacterized protein (DUF3084 family)